ncbi:MAG: chorismate mutase [Spirochaetales bacterium]|nr:chorismate mutase [Spirochaetales bacterium]
MVSVDLSVIAAHLEGLEETIIHRLIDRAQFRENPAAYSPGRSGFNDAGDRSLFDLRLRHQEEMDAAFGRFEVPEECPFHADLPAPRRSVALPESPLEPTAAAAVNCTPGIVETYLKFVPALCESGNDGQHGSSVEHDVLAIQAIGRRVHYGALYVAESKYRASPAQHSAAAESAAAGDRSPLLALITRPEIEDRILRRVSEKVDYIQAPLNLVVRRRIDPQIVLRLYRDTIIPMTKRGEIDYLLARAGR